MHTVHKIHKISIVYIYVYFLYTESALLLTDMPQLETHKIRPNMVGEGRYSIHPHSSSPPPNHAKRGILLNQVVLVIDGTVQNIETIQR